MRVIVAGAGALGSSIAVALARAGAAVTLADPAPAGDNASGVAAGMLAPAFESVFDNRPEHFESLVRARDLWPAFAGSIGIGVERPGALAVSFDEARIEAWRRVLDGLGVVATSWTRVEVARRHPDLAAGLFGLSIEDDWRLDPGPALAALGIEAGRLGVTYRTAAVTGFTPRRADLSDGSMVAADALVVATGASKTLTALAAELERLTPIKGHILRLGGAVGGPGVVRFDGGYLCPASDGILLGATMEVGRCDQGVEASKVDALISLGARYAPRLAEGTVSARAGVRASTADGMPLVGRASAQGVWLAVGARRNGWLLAPAIAGALVEQLIGHG